MDSHGWYGQYRFLDPNLPFDTPKSYMVSHEQPKHHGRGFPRDFSDWSGEVSGLSWRNLDPDTIYFYTGKGSACGFFKPSSKIRLISFPPPTNTTFSSWTSQILLVSFPWTLGFGCSPHLDPWKTAAVSSPQFAAGARERMPATQQLRGREVTQDRLTGVVHEPLDTCGIWWKFCVFMLG